MCDEDLASNCQETGHWKADCPVLKNKCSNNCAHVQPNALSLSTVRSEVKGLDMGGKELATNFFFFF